MADQGVTLGNGLPQSSASFLRLNLDLSVTDTGQFVHQFEESFERRGCAIVVDRGLDADRWAALLSQLAASDGDCLGNEEPKTKKFRRQYQFSLGYARNPKLDRPVNDSGDGDPSVDEPGRHDTKGTEGAVLATITELSSDLHAAAARTLSSIAKFLWLEEGWFGDKVSPASGMLQIISRYDGCGHFDFPELNQNADVISLILIGGAVKLDVRHRWHQEEWQRVELTGGELLVLAGTMLQRMTNDIITPPLYRVVGFEDRDSPGIIIHLSVPFNDDVVVEPIPECVDWMKYPNRYPNAVTARDLRQMEGSANSGNRSGR